MSRTAVIFRSTGGAEAGPGSPAFPPTLLGLTLLERAVLSLRQKGVERIVIVGDRHSLTAEATDLRPRVVGRLPEFMDAADEEKLRAVLGGDGEDVLRVREEVVCDVAVTSPESYREAERRLLESVRKDTDGFISRTLNRPVSLRLSKVFIRLGLTPNQISVGNLVAGLVGAWLAASGGYFNIALGALLFQLSSIVDGSDGEVAKLTYTGSDRGSWIDTLCDELTCLAFFVALPVGLYRATGDGVYMALIAGTLLSGAVLYALMIRYVSGTKDHGSMVQILDDFRESARLPGLFGGINRFVSSLSFVVRRDFFAFVIMVLCLVGQARLVVWIIGVLAPVSVLYFAYYSRRKRKEPAAAADPEHTGGSAG
jgi:phosphatidylglycerophosphate synthase